MTHKARHVAHLSASLVTCVAATRARRAGCGAAALRDAAARGCAPAAVDAEPPQAPWLDCLPAVTT